MAHILDQYQKCYEAVRRLSLTLSRLNRTGQVAGTRNRAGAEACEAASQCPQLHMGRGPGNGQPMLMRRVSVLRAIDKFNCIAPAAETMMAK
jgi:hypothetical protein